MAKTPTKADLVAIINNLELRVAQLSTQPADVPSADVSIAAIAATLDDHTPCPKCNGTGKFHNRDGEAVGDCFACKGKGWQSASDLRRNDTYSYHRDLSALIADEKLPKFLRPSDIPLEAKRGKRLVQHNSYWYVI